MSEENVELARKAIDALNRRDFDALLAFLSRDVVWEALEGVSGIGELYRGRAGVREWIALMFEDTWRIVWFADGLITRRQVFWTRAEALKTAGLRE
jgi:ketosteroid isomerase-like protein